MSSGSEFKHSSVEDQRSIVAYLRALMEGVEAGRLELESGEQRLELTPGGLLELEIRVKQKSGRNRMLLKIDWRDRKGEPQQKSDRLTIRGE